LIRLEIATLVVDGRPETGQELRRRLLLETNANDETKFLFEPIGGLTATAGLEVTPNPPGSKCRKFAIEIAVDILEGVIAVLAHVGSIVLALRWENALFDSFGG
jgi:hypothetical protein